MLTVLGVAAIALAARAATATSSADEPADDAWPDKPVSEYDAGYAGERDEPQSERAEA